MRILIVGHYNGDGSPTASHIHDQVKAYAALGHDVLVLAPVALGKRDYFHRRFRSGMVFADNIPHLTLHHVSLSNFGEDGFNTKSAICSIKKWLNKLKDFRPDIIHAHTFGTDTEIGKYLKKCLGVPLVITTHGSDTSIPYEQGNLDFLRSCCDGADQVIAVSSALADKVRACGTSTPVSTILNGFAVQHTSQIKEKKFPCSLIQVGSLQKQKRFDTTLLAFSQTRNAYPEAKLTLIGQGTEREHLESLSRELGVADAVHFTGLLPNNGVLAEMARSQFFCMPSVREGFGIVYLEAMASGCITIGTEGEGIADLIVSGENGFLVPPDDPEAIVRVIDWCITHPEEAATIAERGRRDALALTWEKNAKEYITLFKEFVQNGTFDTK